MIIIISDIQCDTRGVISQHPLLYMEVLMFVLFEILLLHTLTILLLLSYIYKFRRRNVWRRIVCVLISVIFDPLWSRSPSCDGDFDFADPSTNHGCALNIKRRIRIHPHPRRDVYPAQRLICDPNRRGGRMSPSHWNLKLTHVSISRVIDEKSTFYEKKEDVCVNFTDYDYFLNDYSIVVIDYRINHSPHQILEKSSFLSFKHSKKCNVSFFSVKFRKPRYYCTYSQFQIPSLASSIGWTWRKFIFECTPPF